MPSETGISPAASAASEDARGRGEQLSVYVHVPFCIAKCGYCDFYSIPGGDDDAAPFAAALLARARLWLEFGLGRGAVSLYLGGGTPTMLGDALPPLIEDLAAALELAAGAEITVEANPDSLSTPLARNLAAAGVTRVSVGVQSLDDSVLTTLGRAHDSRRAEEAVGSIRAVGLDAAIDLMCGVPGQTDASWSNTLARAIALEPVHVSVYPLTVQEGTPMYAAVEMGRMSAPDPDVAADHMIAAEAALGEAGIARYEVANYALPGKESVHNLGYWTGRPYLGIGPGAYGSLPARLARRAGLNVPAGAARVRFLTPADLDRFMSRPAAKPVVVETLTAAEARREDAMLGLRLVEGIADGLASSAGVESDLESLTRDGLVEHVGARWRTTQRGWLLGNEVFGRVLAGA